MKREFKRLLEEKGRTELPRVLLCSAECAPISKTGGLADVVRAPGWFGQPEHRQWRNRNPLPGH